MSNARIAIKLSAAALTAQLLPLVCAGASAVQNLTGLPVYPNLSAAAMDSVVKTDTLGRWCSRFSAETSYPLDVVETWYRRALASASETDLTHDERYKIYPRLSGIKLALGIDYVTIFKVANQTATSIELFRCSWGPAVG
jgi:hypothetical protein